MYKSQIDNHMDYQGVWRINGDGVVFYFRDQDHRDNLNKLFTSTLDPTSILGVKIINR